MEPPSSNNTADIIRQQGFPWKSWKRLLSDPVLGVRPIEDAVISCTIYYSGVTRSTFSWWLAFLVQSAITAPEPVNP
ncbi:hypothetical protein J6590_060420 [Homalodisca vitripennis]|nr:hypothetical protein J6590_060420 [Homalodisca vitripennis]